MLNVGTKDKTNAHLDIRCFVLVVAFAAQNILCRSLSLSRSLSRSLSLSLSLSLFFFFLLAIKLSQCTFGKAHDGRSISWILQQIVIPLFCASPAAEKTETFCLNKHTLWCWVCCVVVLWCDVCCFVVLLYCFVVLLYCFVVLCCSFVLLLNNHFSAKRLCFFLHIDFVGKKFATKDHFSGYGSHE